jgi:hypothetical protein
MNLSEVMLSDDGDAIVIGKMTKEEVNGGEHKWEKCLSESDVAKLIKHIRDWSTQLELDEVDR